MDYPGFIFMCNRITKPECYRFRVFGLPAGRREVVESIKPGTYLFLFDTDVKLLYGVYTAASTGRLNIEPFAFGRKFPAQVKFNIYKDCLPLPENHFKRAILDNYQRGSKKFDPELNSTQVRNLLELFRPLHVLSTASPRPVWNETYSPSTLPQPPMNNVFHQPSRSSFEESYLSKMSPNQAPSHLNYKHVNELAEPTGWAYPVNNLMPNSAAAQAVLSQASRNQIHGEAIYTVTPEGPYAARTVTSYMPSLPDPQYTQQSILNPQPEFQPSLVNRGSDHAQSSQDSQRAHLNVLHPQHEVHSSMMTMHSSYVQSMPYPHHQHQNFHNQPPDYHSAVANMGNSHTQTLWDPHYNHHNIPNQQPNSYYSGANMGSSYAQPLPNPQHSHQEAQNTNVAMQSYAQTLWDPHYNHHNIPNQQPNSCYSMANMGSSYAQPLPNPQHSHQEAQNANVAMQSYAWPSSLYGPYVPQEAVPATYADQGSGAIQAVISSGQQTGMGSEYYQSSTQTAANVSTQENAVSHLHSANSYSLS